MSYRYTLLATVRVGEWWEPKLSLVLAVMYATGQVLHVSIASFWLTLFVILAALIPDAACASVINDVADRADDVTTNKVNLIASRSRPYVITLLAIIISAGILVAIAFRHDALLLWSYLAAWVPFSLYSLSPFRLKVRGMAGVVADALGAHVFPAFLGVLLVYRAAGRQLDWAWIAIVNIWAFALGMRCILWHQSRDCENDARLGLRTFAVRHRSGLVDKVIRSVFVVEVVALGFFLLRVSAYFPIVALFAYGVLGLLRRWRLRTVVSIVPPQRQSDLMLYDYYIAFMPVSLLLASAMTYPMDLLVLAVHLAIFPRSAGHAVKDAWRIMSGSGPKKVLAIAESPL